MKIYKILMYFLCFHFCS